MDVLALVCAPPLDPAAQAPLYRQLKDRILQVIAARAVGPDQPLPSEQELCRAFGPSVRRVEFAFTPAGRDGLEEYEYHAEDTTLFISGSPLAQDLERVRGFPELAHA